MYLINTTFHAHVSLYESTLTAVKALRKKAVGSSLFTDAKITSILIIEDPEARSFSLMLLSENLEQAMEWSNANIAAALSPSDRLVWFTTPMELL